MTCVDRDVVCDYGMLTDDRTLLSGKVTGRVVGVMHNCYVCTNLCVLVLGEVQCC
jgi:hypothetical protein